MAVAAAAAIALAGCGADAPADGETTTPPASTAAVESAPAETTTATETAAPTEAVETEGAGSSLPTAPPEGYSFTLTTPNGIYYIDVPTIESLPQATIDTPQAGQAQQTGALVTALLEEAGVADYAALVVTGPNGAETFTADEIDETVILGVSRRQTLRFSGEQIDKDRWVQDVTDIVVE